MPHGESSCLGHPHRRRAGHGRWLPGVHKPKPGRVHTEGVADADGVPTGSGDDRDPRAGDDVRAVHLHSRGSPYGARCSDRPASSRPDRRRRVHSGRPQRGADRLLPAALPTPARHPAGQQDQRDRLSLGPLVRPQPPRLHTDRPEHGRARFEPAAAALGRALFGAPCGTFTQRIEGRHNLSRHQSARTVRVRPRTRRDRRFARGRPMANRKRSLAGERR